MSTISIKYITSMLLGWSVVSLLPSASRCEDKATLVAMGQSLGGRFGKSDDEMLGEWVLVDNRFAKTHSLKIEKGEGPLADNGDAHIYNCQIIDGPTSRDSYQLTSHQIEDVKFIQVDMRIGDQPGPWLILSTSPRIASRNGPTAGFDLNVLDRLWVSASLRLDAENRLTPSGGSLEVFNTSIDSFVQMMEIADVDDSEDRAYGFYDTPVLSIYSDSESGRELLLKHRQDFTGHKLAHEYPWEDRAKDHKSILSKLNRSQSVDGGISGSTTYVPDENDIRIAYMLSREADAAKIVSTNVLQLVIPNLRLSLYDKPQPFVIHMGVYEPLVNSINRVERADKIKYVAHYTVAIKFGVSTLDHLKIPGAILNANWNRGDLTALTVINRMVNTPIISDRTDTLVLTNDGWRIEDSRSAGEVQDDEMGKMISHTFAKSYYGLEYASPWDFTTKGRKSTK